MGDILLALVKVNAAASVMILLVLAVRHLARRRFGPVIAYRLWIWPPLAGLGVLLPAHMGSWDPAQTHGPLGRLTHQVVSFDQADTVVAGWLAGAAVLAGALLTAQALFLRGVRAGRAGPAVVGILCPRVVMPRGEMFSRDERRLVLDHEFEHIRRGDTRANAIGALLQCLCWFNPLVHVASQLARFDQELACDHAVAHRRPQLKAQYARTLLKTQLASLALPLGCYWPAENRHPLEVRIAELAEPRPTVDSEVTGAMLVGLVWIGVCGAAWLAAVLAGIELFPGA